MKITAIVAEYNPLHRGHQYHIKKTREATDCDYLIAIMSGNFTQRGECAIFDKWARTRMALDAGADLVVELPVTYAAASAERFARGAVEILSALGCVDFLSFGSETAQLRNLQPLASILEREPWEFRRALQGELKKGVSFPAARQAALAAVLSEEAAALLASPNDILAVEYLKALIHFDSRIRPVAILRRGAGYRSDALDCETPSALGIRRALLDGKDVSAYLPGWLASLPGQPVFSESLFPLLAYALRRSTPQSLQNIAGVGEGLEDKIWKAARTARSYEELLSLVKSRRYTTGRIARALLCCLLGVTKELNRRIDGQTRYARILGMREKSASLLSLLSQSSSIPIVTQPAKTLRDLPLEGLRLDALASDLYGILKSPPEPAGRDYTQKLIVR